MDTSIQSIKNPRVMAAARLKQTSERRKTGLFLIEGTHAIQEACATHWPIDSVFMTMEWLSRHRDLHAVLATRSECIVVSEDVLRRVAHSESPDGVVAIGQDATSTEGNINAALSLAVGLEQVQDPGNLGAIIRSAVAAGADGVFLGEGCVDATSPKVLRSSVGQWFRKPPRRVCLPDWIRSCQNSGIQVLGAAAHGTSFWELDLRRPTVFILGNEGAGLTKETLSRMDDIVAVPMHTGVESLNVAMTATLLLYEAIRHRLSQAT